jgi:hypothetical protein
VSACASYSQIELGDVSGHDRVRVTLADGQRETLLDPVVTEDAISGREDQARRSRDPVVPLVIPLEQVSKLESVDKNTGKTVAAVMGGIVAGLLILTIVVYAVDPPEYFGD